MFKHLIFLIVLLMSPLFPAEKNKGKYDKTSAAPGMQLKPDMQLKKLSLQWDKQLGSGTLSYELRDGTQRTIPIHHIKLNGHY